MPGAPAHLEVARRVGARAQYARRDRSGPSSHPLGAALWVAAWTSVGYFSGRHINAIYREATRYDSYLAIAVGAMLLAYLSRALYRRRRRPAAKARPD